MPTRTRSRRRLAIGLATALWAGTCAYGGAKPLPPGISWAGPVHQAPVEFLTDLTYQADTGRVVEQRIFKRVFEMIDAATEFVVIDMFLFNGEHTGDREYIPLARLLTERLIAKKTTSPEVAITLITDEINNFYGAYTSAEIGALERQGIQVVITDLGTLRDSNPAYSSVWRLLFSWLGTGGTGMVPHPLTTSGQKVTLRSYLKLLNFKANHRKVIVTDRECLVTSANPHTASSFHSNIAFVTRGPVCGEVLDAERGVARLSGTDLADRPIATTPSGPGLPLVQYLTEGQIRRSLLANLDSLGTGDRLDVAMFYLSDRRVIDAILRASRRGVAVRVVLDPNKDAFGREKGGIPNRQVAHELVARSDGAIALRWYATHGEQFHTKLVLARRSDVIIAFGGSANLTKRNLGDYNLEADLRVATDPESEIGRALTRYFERIWTNVDGEYTVDYGAYEDRSIVKRAIYRLQEWSGFCSY